jgi:hypothetical protein
MQQPSPLAGIPASFEPALGTAQLSFDLAALNFLRPGPGNWRENWKAYHEWAHFYQFVTTSYGAYYRSLTMAQLLSVARLLLTYEVEATRFRLPLLANEAAPLTELVEAERYDPAQPVDLRLIALLEDYRRLVYGYKVAKPGHEESWEDERRLFLGVTQDMFGLPPLSFYWTSEWLPLEAEVLAQFEISDLLESHAHALSTLWLHQAVERFELPRSIAEESLEEANRYAIGPYGRFFDVAWNCLKVAPKHHSHALCTLCDLALSPPGFNEWQAGTSVAMPDTTWSPLTRLVHLFSLAHNGRLPKMDFTTPGWQWAFMDDLGRSVDPMWAEYFPPYESAPFDTSQELVETVSEKVRAAVDGSLIPPEAGLYLIDGFETYALSDRLRGLAEAPCLLGGNTIEDLQLLVEAVGGPSLITPPGGSGKVFSRVCMGLRNAGYEEAADLSWNDHVVRTGVAWLVGLRLLLYETRAELSSRLDEPLFGAAGPTLHDVLSWYGRDLGDFD